MKWDVVIKKAINPDGSLLFPQRLTKEFLLDARRTMGSYFFANQYLNEVIPDEARCFKPNWIKYWEKLPTKYSTFAFIDPAISQNDNADYTGVVVVSIDPENTWYVQYADHMRLTPTELIDMLFKINKQYSPQVIGIETVAFQEALLYMADSEMRKRGQILPLKSIKYGTDEKKEMRILGLVPRFEWGRIYLRQGMTNFIDELLSFPRGAHDDICDSAASIEKIAVTPEKERITNDRPNPADGANYESWYRRELVKKANQSSDD